MVGRESCSYENSFVSVFQNIQKYFSYPKKTPNKQTTTKKPTTNKTKYKNNKKQQLPKKHTQNKTKIKPSKSNPLSKHQVLPWLSSLGLALHTLLGSANCRDAMLTSAPAFCNNSQLLQWREQKPIPKFSHSTILTSKDKTHSPFMSWHKAHAPAKFHLSLLGFLQGLLWVFP